MVMLSNLEGFKANALECINFRLARSPDDLDASDTKTLFKPEFAHQLYGEDETIFGYSNLAVNISFLAGSLKTLIDVSFSEKLNSKTADMKVDDILRPLQDVFTAGFRTNRNDFAKDFSLESKFKPFGNILSSYHKEGKEFVVYKCDISCAGFMDYHKRLQSFLMFFIDGASFIDDDDDKWVFYLLFEKYQSDGETRHAIIGYATAYKFYCFPDSNRMRLSQFIILPPFFRKGHGSELLRSIYNDLKADSNVKDFTVEDPSDTFTWMRDTVDCKLMSDLPIFKKVSLSSISQDQVDEVVNSLKFNKKQIRHIYEIVQLLKLPPGKDFIGKYKSNLRQRIRKDLEEPQTKLSKMLPPDSEQATSHAMKAEHNATLAEDIFNETFERYSYIVNKVQSM